ncbi:Y-family DNA polymerase [Terrimonas pollutisoli]|uniref:Y-family DNA polymerase n=1 Tax=Terrimonas pollutisoli TaxID=3034147 RepID=UPI0023EB4D74|nr:DNA polymerase Y family protein [Terrimonas sp. H1YJ31]
MAKRFVSIWFRYLTTDWFTLRQPGLCHLPFVLSAPSHGKIIITATNAIAETQEVLKGMAVADARVIIPSLQVADDRPGLADKLLHRLAEWCIRFSPCVAIDPPDGLLLDVSGCSHLWGGDELYLATIINRLQDRGYTVRAAMADTIGAAWAVARFGKESSVIKNSGQIHALLPLPPAALRLEMDAIERLEKLGLRQIKDFIHMPRSAIRRRFGNPFIIRLNQALGYEEEILQPVQPIELYQERLPCLEPIVTATGIEIALRRLLETLCHRLITEQKGLRLAHFKAYRVDGKMEQVSIGTIRPSHSVNHLFKLFEDKLCTIEPDLGIELFVLEAPKVEDHFAVQEKLWQHIGGLDNLTLSELLDRLAGKIGTNRIHRYIPDEHYWPERSIKLASSLDEKPIIPWKTDRPRPIQLLTKPEAIDVTAPIPDYPPMNFRYKGKLHKVIKSDGPERIEQEWWIQEGQHRDYYSVEDEEGRRYWLFRSGHYSAEKTYQWFMHGFFA